MSKHTEKAREIVKMCVHLGVKKGEEIFVQNGVIDSIAKALEETEREAVERCAKVVGDYSWSSKFRVVDEELIEEIIKAIRELNDN